MNMTTQELEKLIARMVDDLSLIAAETDVEKLSALVQEKAIPMNPVSSSSRKG